MFKPYESKPITRMAFQITSDHLTCKYEDTDSSYGIGTHVSEPFIEFKAYQEPKVGDWVVRLNEKDTYHCTDEIFRERNIVPE